MILAGPDSSWPAGISAISTVMPANPHASKASTIMQKVRIIQTLTLFNWNGKSYTPLQGDNEGAREEVESPMDRFLATESTETTEKKTTSCSVFSVSSVAQWKISLDDFQS